MRLAWAVMLGVVLAALAAWWSGRTGDDAASPANAGNATPTDRTPGLYRWRDDAGVVQITGTPPRDRAYERIDVEALQRRNVLDARTETPAAD